MHYHTSFKQEAVKNSHTVGQSQCFYPLDEQSTAAKCPAKYNTCVYINNGCGKKIEVP